MQNRFILTFGRAALPVMLTLSLAGAAHAQVRVSANERGGSASKASEKFTPANPAVYSAAQAHPGTKILISTMERRLRLVLAKDTILDVPIAIGMGTNFEYEGKKFRFETPTGRRTVLRKEEKPLWTVPDWHYMEKAAKRGLKLVRLKDGDVHELSDGTFLMVVDNQVGRLNQNGHFWAFTPGNEVIFDKTIYMPPMTSPQRRVPDALGPYKLELGDGYLIHGTHIYNEDSIGEAVSHGCVRMNNQDLDRLYYLVEPKTPVFIY